MPFRPNFIFFIIGSIFGFLALNAYYNLSSGNQQSARPEEQIATVEDAFLEEEAAELLSSESVWGSLESDLPIDFAQVRASLDSEQLYNTDGLQSVYRPDFVEYIISPGDTLSTIWNKFGVDTSLALLAEKAFKSSEYNINQLLRSGSKVEIEARNNVLTRLTKTISDGAKVSLIYDPEVLEYRVEQSIPEIRVQEVKVSFAIKNSIAATAQSNQLSYDIVDEIVDIFGSKIAFTKDIHPGDTFTVIYDQRSLDNGKILAPGKVRAASVTARGKAYMAMNFPSEQGKNQYFDEEGMAIGNFFLRYPVKFSRISSVFTTSRFHPVLKISRPHNGVDFAAPTGTPVRAVADAQVDEASYHRGNGNWVKLKHSPKYSTAYLHLSKIAPGVKKGFKVARGDVIGYVGSTGLSSGPHLHYSFYVDGKYVDPMKIELPVLDSQKIDSKNAKFKRYLRMLREKIKEDLE